MENETSIVSYNLRYQIDGTAVNIHDFTHTFYQQKIGIVGDNGIGKSTLLKLIMGELLPQFGSISVLGSICYCPQDYRRFYGDTVADILGVTAKLEALRNITMGNMDQINFETLNDDWNVERKVASQLELFGLEEINRERAFSTLSAGQKTRLLLIRSILNDSDFLLFDEPTNNLDIKARHILYDFVSQTERGLLMVSHDRNLLQHCDQIIELTSKGITIYGGDFTDYTEQKKINENAIERQYEDAKKAQKKAQRSVQLSLEVLDKKRSKGRKLFVEGKIDRNEANGKRGRSERTQARLNTQEARLLSSVSRHLNSAKQMREIKEEINVSLHKTSVPNGKMVLAIEDLTYQYTTIDRWLFSKFKMSIFGAERVALVGSNGVGKTTLLKIICGELSLVYGTVAIGIEHWSYLNQDIDMLFTEQTILENFKRINPDLLHEECHHALAQFKFRNKDADKLVSNLSGGEKIRAGLACVLMSSAPPQLLVLDEPTNHLDMVSILALEEIVNQYQGALLVVSHDATFLEKINVKRYVDLSALH
ncbi:MAG: yheS 1 [Solimicrobium sp.]|nr:yheS 1 [Solimicrobium sp.]